MDPGGNGHFRSDLNRVKDGIRYEELLAEMRAQIDRCVSILGKAPDTMEMMSRVRGLLHVPLRRSGAVCAELPGMPPAGYARAVLGGDQGMGPG